MEAWRLLLLATPHIAHQVSYTIHIYNCLSLSCSVVEPNYFLRFWMKNYVSGSDFWQVPVPVPAPYLDHKKQIFQQKFWQKILPFYIVLHHCVRIFSLNPRRIHSGQKDKEKEEYELLCGVICCKQPPSPPPPPPTLCSISPAHDCVYQVRRTRESPPSHTPIPMVNSEAAAAEIEDGL